MSYKIFPQTFITLAVVASWIGVWSRRSINNITQSCYNASGINKVIIEDICIIARYYITTKNNLNRRTYLLGQGLRDSVLNHQPHDCFLNRLFGRRSSKTSKLRVTGLCAGNSPGTGEFPAQMASNAENVSIWWRHHEFQSPCHLTRCPLGDLAVIHSVYQIKLEINILILEVNITLWQMPEDLVYAR